MESDTLNSTITPTPGPAPQYEQHPFIAWQSGWRPWPSWPGRSKKAINVMLPGTFSCLVWGFSKTWNYGHVVFSLGPLRLIRIFQSLVREPIVCEEVPRGMKKKVETQWFSLHSQHSQLGRLQSPRHLCTQIALLPCCPTLNATSCRTDCFLL